MALELVVGFLFSSSTRSILEPLMGKVADKDEDCNHPADGEHLVSELMSLRIGVVDVPGA